MDEVEHHLGPAILAEDCQAFVKVCIDTDTRQVCASRPSKVGTLQRPLRRAIVQRYPDRSVPGRRPKFLGSDGGSGGDDEGCRRASQTRITRPPTQNDRLDV